MARVGAPGAGGLSLSGQERLTGAGVGKSVFSRLLLQGHTLQRHRRALTTRMSMQSENEESEHPTDQLAERLSRAE